MRSLYSIGFVCLLLAGCAHNMAKRSKDLSIGMSKVEVIKVMGQPERIIASEGTETLVFGQNESIMVTFHPGEEFLVVLFEGKVAQYGNRSDLRQGNPNAIIQPIIQMR